MKFKAVFQDHMPSKGKTIKLHKFLSHFLDSVYRLGHPKHYHAQQFEAQHRHTKALARAGNFRPDSQGQTVAHMIKVQKRLEVMHAMEAEDIGYQADAKKEYMTAHKVANMYGVDTLMGKGTKVSSWRATGNNRGYTKHLPAALQAYERRTNRSLCPAITTHQSAIVRTIPSWNPTANFSLLQTIRASGRFHGRAWYDGVQYCHHRNAVLQHGIVRCIFSVSIHGQEEPEDKDSDEYKEHCDMVQLALVQKLRPCRSQTSALGARGNTHLSCEHVGTGENRLAVFEVIPLCNIIRRAYLMPDYDDKEGHTYYHDTYKWDRYEKDNRSLAELEGGRYQNGVIT